jgi:hypothetical protein
MKQLCVCMYSILDDTCFEFANSCHVCMLYIANQKFFHMYLGL